MYGEGGSMHPRAFFGVLGYLGFPGTLILSISLRLSKVQVDSLKNKCLSSVECCSSCKCNASQWTFVRFVFTFPDVVYKLRCGFKRLIE